MNSKECLGMWSWPDVRYYPCTVLDGLRKTTETHNKDDMSPGQDLNLQVPKYKVEMSPT